VRTVESSRLNLDTEIRFHLATELHDYVARLLAHGDESARCTEVATRLRDSGYRLLVTRDLDRAKDYLRERYAEHRDARFGLVASSKDRDLEAFGIANGFQDTKRLQVGPWFSEDEAHPRSCRHLKEVVTEFQAQGLELDAVLLAWGTDFVRSGARWSNSRARGYRPGAKVKDPFQLRLNAYRVLLTRARDANVVFVPALPMLDETYEHVRACGFAQL
jgi:hypothetical protein